MGQHIIDALVVLFSLDSSGFKDGVRDIADGTKRLKENTKTAFTEIEKSTDRLREGIGGVSREVVGLGLAFLGAKSMVGFAANMASGTATADRFSKTLGMNIQQVWAWRQALKEVNGSAADADASLQAIQNAKMAYKLTGKVPESTAFGRLGISGSDWDSSNASDILKKVAKAGDKMDPQVFSKLATQIGLPQSTIYLMQKGSSQVDALIDQFKGNSRELEESARQTEDLQKEMADLNAKFQEALIPVLIQLLPILTDFAAVLAKFTEKKQETGNAIKGAISGAAGGAIMGGPWGAAAGAILGAVGGYNLPTDGTGAATPSSDPNWARSQRNSIDAFTSGRGGGNSRADRNNNPGNIEYGPFARAHGAIGTDGRFAKFPSPEHGFAAMESLLAGRAYMGSGRNTLMSILSKYAPASENHVGAYAAHVSRLTGLGVNQPLTREQLSMVVRAMAQHEGFSSTSLLRKYLHPSHALDSLRGINAAGRSLMGQRSSAVTINGGVNVTTPAHNGHQIARDVHAGLKRRMQVAQADPVVRS